MSARTKARKRAVDVIFESDLREAALLTTLAAWQERADPPVPAFTTELVTGVAGRWAAIDAALRASLIDWSLERVAPVDRSILRSAIYELLWVDETPDAVVIDEAVELAKSLSADESPGFVNGVLARVLAHKSELVAAAVVAAPLDAVASVGEFDSSTSVGVEHTPGDQALGEGDRGLVVDHSE